MFLDEVPVNAGDIGATVYKGTDVNGFHGVQGYNKLNWNLHGRDTRLYHYSIGRKSGRTLC